MLALDDGEIDRLTDDEGETDALGERDALGLLNPQFCQPVSHVGPVVETINEPLFEFPLSSITTVPAPSSR